MADHRRRLGAYGERLAADFLERRGAVITDRNRRVGRGEIDLIARLDGEQVAVEVKTRVEHRLGTAADAFTAAKGGQVRALAGQLGIRRVDLVTVTLRRPGVDITWSSRVA